MSEYLSKKALLESIRKEYLKCLQYADQTDWAHGYRAALVSMESAIQSGAFDVTLKGVEEYYSLQYESQQKIQHLRAALGVLANKNNWFETYDSIVPTIAWAGGNKTPYEIANEALYATSESTGTERVREIECPFCGCEIKIMLKGDGNE